MRACPPPCRRSPSALGALLRSDPSRPLVTFYDDATGERVELSVATYANWVAKTAGLAQDELDAERGRPACSSTCPRTGSGAVWLGAAWSLGLAVTDDPGSRTGPTWWSAGPERRRGVRRARAGGAPVVALSLRPLGGRFTEPLPAGVTDYGAVVLAQPDAFVAVRPAGRATTPPGATPPAR